MNDAKVDVSAPEQNVNASEVLEAFKGPGIYANKLYMAIMGNNVRITFCEQVPDSEEIVFRSAIVLPIESLPNFSQLVNQIINKYYSQLQAKMQEQMAKQQAANIHMAENMKQPPSSENPNKG